MRLPISPCGQGSLDQLCGLYSVINAIQLCAGPWANIRQAQRQDLFQYLVRTLNNQDVLADTMINGSSNKRLSILLLAAQAWLARELDIHLASAKPFHRNRKASKGQVWAALGNHLSDRDSAAIIRITEPFDHWTVIASVRKRYAYFAVPIE